MDLFHFNMLKTAEHGRREHGLSASASSFIPHAAQKYYFFHKFVAADSHEFKNILLYNMNDILHMIGNRASVRDYTPQAVTPEQTEQLLRAAMAAPSSKNRQPWHFIVVSQAAVRQALATRLPYAKMLHDAPLSILVCGDTDVHAGEAAMSWVMDCSAATENLLLAAVAMGLGAVWTAVYPYEDRITAAREVLSLPGNIVPLNVVAVGHPAKQPAPKDKWQPGRIHYERWN
jgi:nitroreductase